MKQTTNLRNKRSRTRRTWLILVLVILAAGGGAGYYYWTLQTKAASKAATNTTTTSDITYTATVRQGNISISVSGSGTLAAGQENALAFSTSGTVASVNVQVGDQVKKGDELAQLADLAKLQANIDSAVQNLTSAQLALDTFKQNGPSNLANAQLTLVKAQKAVTDAKSNIVEKGWSRCDQATIDAYYYEYNHAKAALDALGTGDQAYYLNTIVPQQNIVARAKTKYDYCTGYTDYEVSASNATLLVAQADAAKAQTAFDSLTKNNGVDPVDLASAENKVANAQLAVESAQKVLAGATLVAPYDGTILSVAGAAGDSVSTSTFITIADLAHPVVNFSADEADMDKITLGIASQVTFDALPGVTFKGKVTRIDPALTTSGSYRVVTGVIKLELDPANASANVRLLKGLNGTVTMLQGAAQNVLLVPAQAVRDIGDGVYAVFVIGPDGKPKMRIVEVGLKDDTSTEIKSGVKLGDVVSTGTVQTK